MPKFIRNRTVNIKRDFYAMSTTVDGDEAEIVMYGEVVEERPVDWWTGEPIEGNFIALNQFMDDLSRVADAKRITIRMNSVGGDVYAALPIHNRLRELDAKITVIVDGVAMSAASFIMCAADTVKVNPASLIMIHKASCILIGWYNADEMREMAGWLDSVDKALVTAYTRKSGRSEDEILAMMTDTTYMTGKEAIDKGFADELMDGEPVSVAASADGGILYVNGRAMRLPYPISGLPENIPTVNPAAGNPAPDSTNTNQPETTGGTEGGTPMPKTLEEFRKENPELANALMAEAQAAASPDAGDTNKAVEAERKRLKEIDEVAALFDDDTVRNAKYGEKPCSAQEMVYRAAQKAAKEGKKFLSDIADDNAASGAQSVGAAPAGEDDGTGEDKTPDQQMADARAKVDNLLGKKREG